MKKATALPLSSDVIFDQCGYGAKWRKRTRVAAWHCGSLDHLRRVCRGHHGTCSFSGIGHIVLSGTDKKGRLLTAQAQIYPKELCRAFANVLAHAAAELSTLRHLQLGSN